jgi:molecular chaperone HtpG
MTSGIVFQVETTRILQILSKEIYDSPLALLRENLQNAYDAVLRMRFAPNGVLNDGGRIDVRVTKSEISITDNGIGMDERSLRENFWKAGSSGKHTASAKRAGVVGTFGIGAMANFGVASRLVVETRAQGSEEILQSVAERDSLKIAEECISLGRIDGSHDVGTTVTATLEARFGITPDAARSYLLPYVGMLPIPVYFNGELLSGVTAEERLGLTKRSFGSLGETEVGDGLVSGRCEVRVDPNSQLLVNVRNVRLGGNEIDGSLVLVQSGGQLMGMRSSFGLAPVPVVGSYQFGGIANLSFLTPTAGREALSRESVEQVNRIVAIAERAASELLSPTAGADRNTAFLQWMIAHKRYDLARKVSVRVLPSSQDIPLEELQSFIGKPRAFYYVGTERSILDTFASEEQYLIQIAQANPRRAVQLHYVTQNVRVPAVPDSAQVTRVYRGTDLRVAEASVLVRIATILRDDYLIPDVDVVLAEISHGVMVLPEVHGSTLRLAIARSSTLLPPLLEFYDQAYGVFTQFMKDFVRVHIYPRIQQFVPSSTRDGVDALHKILQRNRELYRYEETERGDLERVLGDYLTGDVNFVEVLRRARSTTQSQSQRVFVNQVGAIESEVPDVVASPVTPAVEGQEYEPSPPIVRDEISSDMKILTTTQKYRQLNNFSMLLGLSDRLMRTEAEFFRGPHSTRIVWGGHRVIYIFTEATGRLSLYYDIELRDAIDSTTAAGGAFPTTTLITKNRIFVPVPDALAEEFRLATGSKEFFVRFDLLSSDVE